LGARKFVSTVASALLPLLPPAAIRIAATPPATSKAIPIPMSASVRPRGRFTPDATAPDGSGEIRKALVATGECALRALRRALRVRARARFGRARPGRSRAG